MSSLTLANEHTIQVVEVVLQGDNGISAGVRERIRNLLTHGSEATALCAEEISRGDAARLLGINRTTLLKWERGETKTLPAWPGFSLRRDLKGRRRFLREEVLGYLRTSARAGEPS
jgi:hypothetical protein